MPILPVILAIASAAGAIGSANGKKYIDPQWLDDHFGARAFGQQFNEYLKQMQSSSVGQQMFDEAHTLGQQMANQIRANATASGFGGSEGAQSGGSLFATSTADQITNNLRRQANAQLSQQALQQAQDYMAKKMAAITSDQGRMTPQGATWGAIGQAAGIGLNAGWGAPAPTNATSTDTSGTQTPKTDTATPKTQTPATDTKAMQPVAQQTVAQQTRLQTPSELALPRAEYLQQPTIKFSQPSNQYNAFDGRFSRLGVPKSTWFEAAQMARRGVR